MMDKGLPSLLTAIASGDDERAEAAIEGLAALAVKNPDVVDVLEKLLAGGGADARWWAARALAAISSPRVPLLLLNALGDRDPAVRQCAALGLRLHPDPRTIQALISMLDDPDFLCGELAADALTETGEPGVPRLLDVMETGTPAARLRAARALAHIGDQRAIPALFAALDKGSALLEYWAREGLERMGVGMVFFNPE